jgi:hypothetical protein
MLQTTISPLKRLFASPLQFRDYFAVESSLQSLDSVRMEPREGENRPERCSSNNLRAKWN